MVIPDIQHPECCGTWMTPLWNEMLRLIEESHWDGHWTCIPSFGCCGWSGFGWSSSEAHVTSHQWQRWRCVYIETPAMQGSALQCWRNPKLRDVWIQCCDLVGLSTLRFPWTLFPQIVCMPEVHTPAVVNGACVTDIFGWGNISTLSMAPKPIFNLVGYALYNGT